MLSLWGRKKRKPLTDSKRPSPEHQGRGGDAAQNPDESPDGCKDGLSGIFRPIEGASPCISVFTYDHIPQGRKGRLPGLIFGRADAGMTVEAAILLPLFLFVFLNLGLLIEMIRLRGNLHLALWQIGRELSLYGYVLDSGEAPEDDGQEDDAWWKDLGGIVFASTFIKNKLVQLAGKEYLDSSPLTKGSNGLALWESDIFGDEDTMDIVVTYSVSPWIRLTGIPSFRLANRYYAHIWNGYEVSSGEAEEKILQIVYVTENASVYHLSRDCTHLRLSVREIPAEQIEWVRNQDGRRYRPCEKCSRGETAGTFYIAAEGDCYHYSRGCSGLRRTVYAVNLTEAADLRPCSRCGQTVR